MAYGNWIEKELCVMLWCQGWGLLPLFQNTWVPLLARLKRDVHGKKQMFSAGIPWQGRERLINTPWCGELGLALCAAAAGPLTLRAAPSALLLPPDLRIEVEFNRPTNTQVWSRVLQQQNEDEHSRIPVLILTSQSEQNHCAPGFNCHRMATLSTCFSTYLLVSNLITIQSRGKTLIFIRFRNTQKIFRRNSCHTEKNN